MTIADLDLRVDSPETLTWQQEQNTAAASHLAARPARERLGAMIAANLTDTRLAPVRRCGDRWFQVAVLEPDAEQPVAVVRDSPDGAPRVLLDANVLTAERGRPVALLAAYPAPDGRTLACLVSEAGTEQVELHLVDVASGTRLADDVPWNMHDLAWSADSASLWIVSTEVVDGVLAAQVRHHALGGPSTDPVTLPDGIFSAHVLPAPDGRRVVIQSGNTEQRLDWLLEDGQLRPFLRDVPGGFTAVWHGPDLLAVVDGDAPRGRLVRIPVATAADPATWAELVAESDDVLRSVAVVGTTIVLGYLSDASSRLRLLDLSGTTVEEIALPSEGTVSAYAYGATHPGIAMFATGHDEISFLHSSFETSWAVYRYVVSERRLEQVTPPAIVLDGLVLRTITATSSDGSALPTHVVHRADLDLSLSQPTLIYGYGGFNLGNLPAFVAEWTAWIQAGGVFVLTHLRGGSEFGAEWWRQGTRETKQLTFDDLYAIAEHLIASGITTTQQLAVKGESNGGMLTGAAVVQRPDLWAAVVSDVPLLDLLEYHRDPVSFAIGSVEYGNPHIPAEAEWLRRISPPHNVLPAEYPATLVTAGANDPRCPAWHARSFVGRLQQAQQGDAPVLLRVYDDQGHAVTGLREASNKFADWLAFVADRTGLTA